jgi:hypothetical protein
MQYVSSYYNFAREGFRFFGFHVSSIVLAEFLVGCLVVNTGLAPARSIAECRPFGLRIFLIVSLLWDILGDIPCAIEEIA